MIVRPNGPGDRLMDASSVSRWLNRARATIIKHCPPVACDVQSKRPLWSPVEVDCRLEGVATRGDV